MEVVESGSRTRTKSSSGSSSGSLEDLDDIEILIGHVKSSLQLGNYEDVVLKSNRIWELDKEESMSWFFKGKAFLALHDFGQSINCLEMAVDLGLDSKETLKECTDLLLQARTKKTLNAIKRTWYQNDTHVFINVLVKGMRRQHVHVLFEDKNVICSMKIPPFNIFYDMFLNLARQIVPENAVVSVSKNKVEVKMEKFEPAITWEELELDTKAKYAKNGPEVKAFVQREEIQRRMPAAPKTWDLEEEEEEEEEEKDLDQDEALRKLFLTLYDDANDDQQKAMTKSFVESKGTTMTTNWEKARKKIFGLKLPKGVSHWLPW